MDPRLRITDRPRPSLLSSDVSTPLVTVAWRELSAEHQRSQAEADHRRQEASALARSLQETGVQLDRLRRSIAAAASQASEASPGGRCDTLAIVDRLEQILRELGLVLWSPAGEPYTAELMDCFENVAARPEPGIREPRIEEVLSPAVFYRSELLQMGKVIVAVPSGSSPDGSCESPLAGGDP